MPDKPYTRIVPKIRYNDSARVSTHSSLPDYAELQVVSNFSFLTGASHPEELIARASELGTRAIALTDINSLAGIVRGHVAAKRYPLQYIVGSKLQIQIEEGVFTLLVYPTDRKSYGNLCRLLTLGKRDVPKDQMALSLSSFLAAQEGLVTIIVPPYTTHDYELSVSPAFVSACSALRENVAHVDLISCAIQRTYANDDRERLLRTQQLSKKFAIPMVVTNDVHYHVNDRHKLQQILSCIKQGTTLERAGYLLFQNAERYIKSPGEMWRLFKDCPLALKRTMEIAELTSTFSLDELRYEYPAQICPAHHTPSSYLRQLVEKGIQEKFKGRIAPHLRRIVEDECALVEELRYEKYFLTCYDIVQFAKRRGILCQGRGAAANSIICYCLGITSVDPNKVTLLFARFISKERIDPPDIDIDFEHERREEVIQYIYRTFGREYAGLAAGVVTFRRRSAIREVGKALGVSNDIVDRLAKGVHRWKGEAALSEQLAELKLDSDDPVIKNLVRISQEILGFPRHLSQHVGGFIICRHPLCETVPILNAAMEGRTIIEWDKNDIEALGILKIDVLALGMLTCIRKAFDLINPVRVRQGASEVALYSLPSEDNDTYNMISRADTVGVFQIESRAQMSMLPKLKPRCYYDLVIQIAIVRPGPIHGNMVHPYLRRRNGSEKVEYPDLQVQTVLERTLGVPLFQEQAMSLAIVCAGFSPGEAEQLRRAMAAWKRNEEAISIFKERIVVGMIERGYSVDFAETCINHLKGFAEYGFPESHAASFALITYASCWIKCHYPAEFLCALLNSQPMGFYRPAQLIADAQAHSVEVLPIDINYSDFDSRIEAPNTVRIGMRMVKGIREEEVKVLVVERENRGLYKQISEIWIRTLEQGVRRATLETLAAADSFNSLGKDSRQALWEIQTLLPTICALEALQPYNGKDNQIALPLQGLAEKMWNDYRSTSISLKAHPIQLARAILNTLEVSTVESLRRVHIGRVKPTVSVAGIAVIRQRPGTAKGVCFITIEDETGLANLVIRPDVFEKHSKDIIMSTALIASGVLDRVGEIVYVTVERVRGIDHAL